MTRAVDVKPSTEHFLDAEQSVHTLLDALERLKREIEDYGSATGAIEQVRDQVGQAVSRLSQLADQTRSVIDVIGRVGTPEILDRIERLRDADATVVKGVETLGKQVTALTELLPARLDSSAAAIREFVASHQREADQRLDSLRSAISDELATEKTRIGRQLRTLAVITAVGLLLVLGTSLAGLPFVRKLVGW